MSGDVLALLWLMFLLVVAAWLLSTLAVPGMARGALAGAREPATRGRRVLLTASMPWVVPAIVGGAVLATAGAKGLGWIADHCPHHGLDHPHLCFSHLPAIDLGWMHGILAGAFALPVILGLAGQIRAEYRATRELRLLSVFSTSCGRLRIVPTPAPFALAGGLIEPMVLVSRGLLKHLSARERRIVLAHEAAHLRHGDVRRNVLFELLLRLHLPAVRRRLRQEWLRALEERADDAVARRFGAERVVETLLHVARLRLHQPPVPGISVAGANLTHRARRLLGRNSGGGVGLPAFEVAYAFLLSMVFAAAFLGHHALETLLGLIVGL